MYMHLLVPLDGSRLAETALPSAVFLARKLNSRITLLHVVERRAPDEIHGERHLTATDEAHRYLSDLCANADLQNLRIDVRVEAEGPSGVARSIVELAVSTAADLIVMCTHGSSGLRHLLLGSNAQQIIAFGQVPVLQVRPAQHGSTGLACGNTLVPLDGMPEHEAGLSAAKELSRACGSAVHLLVVVPTLGSLRGERAAAAQLLPGATTVVLDMSIQGAQDYLNRLLAGLHKDGYSASGEIQRGDPVRAIERVAKRIGAGLIVVGTHRRAGTDAFWTGSVAPKISNRSHVPLLLIPLSEK